VENIPHTVQDIPASGSSPAKIVSVLKILPDADHKNNNFQLQGNLLLAEDNNLVAASITGTGATTGAPEIPADRALNPQGTVISTTNKVIGEKPLPDSKYKSLGIFAQG